MLVGTRRVFFCPKDQPPYVAPRVRAPKKSVKPKK
jgi:hypothetical protein